MYIRMEFPLTLITFIMIETIIVILLFPIERNIAFALLRTARNGKEITIGMK